MFLWPFFIQMKTAHSQYRKVEAAWFYMNVCKTSETEDNTNLHPGVICAELRAGLLL